MSVTKTIDVKAAATAQTTDFFFTYSDSFFGIPTPWPLVACIASGLFYVVLVYLIWPLFRPSSPQAIRQFERVRFCHNVFLCLYSGGCCAATAWFMYTQGELNIFQVGLRPMLCNVNVPDWMYYLNLTFIASKVYEWVDTAFLVFLTKRGPRAALSFLHIYHHATTFWLFLVVTNFDSTLKLGMLLNGFVHFIMYWHYAAPWPKKVVPFITMAQLAQLAFVTYAWHFTGHSCEVYVLLRAYHPATFWTPYSMVPVYMFFFVKFFIERFVFGVKKKTHMKKE